MSDFDAARKRLEQCCEGMEAHTMVEIDGKPSDFRIARVEDIRLLLAEVERLKANILDFEIGWGNARQRAEKAEAEVERLRSEVVTQSDVSRKNIGLAKALVETQQAAKKAEAEVERLKADLVFKQIDYDAFARMKQRAEKAEAEAVRLGKEHDQCHKWNGDMVHEHYQLKAELAAERERMRDEGRRIAEALRPAAPERNVE